MYVTVIYKKTNEVIVERCPVAMDQRRSDVEYNISTNIGYCMSELSFVYA